MKGCGGASTCAALRSPTPVDTRAALSCCLPACLPACLPGCPGPTPLHRRPLWQGWDKTYCLRFVKPDFDEIHFFGDKTFKVGGEGGAGGEGRAEGGQQPRYSSAARLLRHGMGGTAAGNEQVVISAVWRPAAPLQGGNDYEIFESPDTVGHTVVGPDDTIAQLQRLFPPVA